MHTFTFPRKCGGSGGVVSHGLCGVGAMPVRAGPGGQGGAGTGLPWSCGHVVM